MQIHSVFGKGLCSNSYILTNSSKEKIIVIDLGMKGVNTGFTLQKNLRKIIGKNNPNKIEVILTHCHLDHILGSDNLEDYDNIVYSASKETANHINKRDEVTLIHLYNATIDYKITNILEAKEKISIAKTFLEVIPTPGHTEGGISLYEPSSKSLFVGDVVFAGGSPGRVDLPTANRKTLINTIETLREMSIKRIYPGHGKIINQNIDTTLQLAIKHLKH
ncbi:MAG: MBL fold metallo-hydrolase [Asgard group archaeon]|nr:MBL fold metallo-hydrolase [Asgard group archaeon]